MNKIRVWVCDTDRNWVQSLQQLLDLSPEAEYAGGSDDCANLANQCLAHHADIVIVNAQLASENRWQCLQSLQARAPEVQVVIQTVFEDTGLAFEGICHGAFGYLSRRDPPRRMLQVLQEVHEGGGPMDPTLASRINAFLQQHEAHHVLQPRQLQVLNLLAEGQNFRLTADQLGISYYAVHKHVRAIYDALHHWHTAHA